MPAVSTRSTFEQLVAELDAAVRAGGSAQDTIDAVAAGLRPYLGQPGSGSGSSRAALSRAASRS